MEDTHGEIQVSEPDVTFSLVLILIIMEDTHGVLSIGWKYQSYQRLNPYYNGRYSWSHPERGKGHR